MKKLFILIFLLTLIIGCTEDKIIYPPAADQSYAIAINGLPESLMGFKGSTHEIPLRIEVKTLNGKAASGLEVNLTGLDEIGFVSPASAVTDRFGIVEGIYSVVLPAGSNTVRIAAEVEGMNSIEEILLLGTNYPAHLTLTTVKQVYYVPQNMDTEVIITAAVSDSNRIGIQGVNIESVITPVFGAALLDCYVDKPEPTDINGRTKLTFHSSGEFGTFRIYCSIAGEVNQFETIMSEIDLAVMPLPQDQRNLTLTATPDVLRVPFDESGEALIIVTARDDENKIIPDLNVTFTTSLGQIQASSYTDDRGIASVSFNNNFEYGTATVIARVPGTEWEARGNIEVVNPYDEIYTINLVSNRQYIYADNGVTSAKLVVHLRNTDGTGMAGERIVFTSTHGVVTASAITDSLGRAFGTFTDTGVPSLNENLDPIPATVKAKFPHADIESAVQIQILEQNPVADIYLHADAVQLVANNQDSTRIIASCYYDNGSPAAPGTEVRFSAVYGRFNQSIASVEGNSGIAETYYHAAGMLTKDTLTAKVMTEFGEVTSNMVLLHLIPGTPAEITLTSDHDELIVNNQNSIAEIAAFVQDAYGNPAQRGLLVEFSTTLGAITESGITDENGNAQARFLSGRITGEAEIRASVQTPTGEIATQILLPIISGSPNRIELEADPLELTVRGVGFSWSTLRATVYDPLDNLVSDPFPVVFELINEPAPPAGGTIGEDEQIFIAWTNNGVAVATLNGGTQIGGKLIRAYTWPDSANNPDRIIEVINDRVAVVAGGPFQLDLDVNDRGIDAGGGAWALEVSVRVWDIHRNPVGDDIPVVLSVDPEIANISFGHTGNVGRNGISSPGLAVVEMIYNSVDTFDPIEISAEIQTQRGQIIGRREHILPLQRGSLTLHTDPGNWRFDDDNPDATIRCWAVLTDGHQIRINNAPILFSSNRSRFSWLDFSNDQFINFFPATARKCTGVVDRQNNEEPGEATVFLRGDQDDFFLDNFDNETMVTIEAQVDGSDVAAEPRFVTFTRRQ